MKPSKFNYFVKHNEKTICFNGNTGRAIEASENETEIIKSIIKGKRADKPSLTTWLYNNGFIVDDQTNELDAIRLRNRIDVFRNSYHLNINPTLECTFNCWYCYEKHFAGHMSKQTIENIKKYVFGLVTKNKITGFNLGWFGGEPLLYFDKVMYPIASYVKNLCETHNIPIYHNITTNGYLINQDMIKKFDEIGLRRFQITLDGDEKTHNNTRNYNGAPSFKTIVNNINDLLEYLPKCNLLLRINYTNEIIEKDYTKILAVIPEKNRKMVHVHFHRVWQTYKTEVTPDGTTNPWLIKWLDALGEMGFNVHPDTTYYPGKSTVCYVDRFNYANINYDGKVYKCTARDYSEETVYGTLSEDGIKWNKPMLEKLYATPHFENDSCTKCKHLAICGGPCPQAMLDFKSGKASNFCHLKTKELSVDSFIIEHHKAIIKYNKSLAAEKA